MIIKGILIGFLIITIPITIINLGCNKLKNWLVENVNRLLFYDIAIIIFYIGFICNSFIENIVDNIGEVDLSIMQFVLKHMVSSGLMLVVILFVIGCITRVLYEKGTRLFNIESHNLNESEIEIIFIFSVFICMVLSIATNGWKSMTYLSIFAILLGKIVWIDTTPKKFLKEITQPFIENIKATRIGIFILAVMTISNFIPKVIEWKLAVGVWIGLIMAIILFIVIGIKISKKVIIESDM